MRLEFTATNVGMTEALDGALVCGVGNGDDRLTFGRYFTKNDPAIYIDFNSSEAHGRGRAQVYRLNGSRLSVDFEAPVSGVTGVDVDLSAGDDSCKALDGALRAIFHSPVPSSG